MTKRTPRAAVYAGESTLDQTTENQLAELRRYTEARGWTAEEYIDEGVSGAKENRPALDSLLRDARRRRFDGVVCWRLDRLGRNLKHLITLLEDLQALGIAVVSLNEGIDATTPTGRLQMHILGAIAQSSGRASRNASGWAWRVSARKESSSNGRTPRYRPSHGHRCRDSASGKPPRNGACLLRRSIVGLVQRTSRQPRWVVRGTFDLHLGRGVSIC